MVSDTGGDITIPLNSVVAELVTTSDQTVTKCKVAEAQNSKYQVVYTPKKRGKHQLHLKIEGRHVQNSPFSVLVMPPLTCFQKPIATFPNLKGAWGIGITSIGQLVVAEAGANQVTILTQDGVKIRSFGTKGSANGQFDYPGGIAIDNEDNIYVADANNHRIQKFNQNGGFIAAAGSQGSNPLQFHSPQGITYNKSDGNLYVSDGNNHRIQVLTTGLQFLKAMGSKGNGNGQLHGPLGVACDSKGQIYVADYGNNRVQVFTAVGKYSYTIGAKKLQGPFGITLDTTGRVYVTEHMRNRISIFTQTGQYIKSFASIGQYPAEIVIETENMHFFISYYGSNSLMKF